LVPQKAKHVSKVANVATYFIRPALVWKGESPDVQLYSPKHCTDEQHKHFLFSQI